MRLLTSETSNKGETPYENETHKKICYFIFQTKEIRYGKRFVMKKFAKEKLAMAGQENPNGALSLSGKNLHKNHRGFVVIGQK